MIPQFKPVADHALLVEFASEPSEDATRAVAALDHALAEAPIDGVIEIVPAIVNLLICFDPLLSDHAEVQAAVQSHLSTTTSATRDPKTHHVGVCYDSTLGPDLSAVATACGLSEDAVINAHLASNYRVAMYGFAPGYAYLDGTSDEIRIPRKIAAVRNVPAGSVIIAGPQCLITTLTMPTGWSIIGRSTVQVFQDDPKQPFLFNVGDHVRFERITIDAFHAQSQV